MKNHRRSLPFIILLSAGLSPSLAEDGLERSARQVIESYIKAYNEADPENMGKLMHDDIQWITIKDEKASITSRGKSAMMEGLNAYFDGSFRISSSLGGWGENGNYVSVVETASWTGKSGKQQSQSANVVYQVEKGLIHRVWYFPEQSPAD